MLPFFRLAHYFVQMKYIKTVLFIAAGLSRTVFHVKHFHHNRNSQHRLKRLPFVSRETFFMSRIMDAYEATDQIIFARRTPETYGGA